MPESGLLTLAVPEVEWIEDLDVVPGQTEMVEQIETLEGAIRARPQQWSLRLRAAQAYASNGEFAAAASHLRACRDLVSDPAVAAGVCFNLGVCLENLDHWRDAARAYEQCADALPNLYWAHFKLGTCWMRLEEWRLAAAAFRRAADIDGRRPDVYRSLRDALSSAGLPREADAAHSRLQELRHRGRGEEESRPN